MRLTQFSRTQPDGPNSGSILLPTYRARSTPFNNTTRVKIRYSANGPVVDVNGGSDQGLEVLRHTGSYIYDKPANEHAILRLIDPLVTWDVQLSRDSLAGGDRYRCQAILNSFSVTTDSQGMNWDKVVVPCTFVFTRIGPWSAAP